jgi:hypothetical protein
VLPFWATCWMTKSSHHIHRKVGIFSILVILMCTTWFRHVSTKFPRVCNLFIKFSICSIWVWRISNPYSLLKNFHRVTEHSRVFLSVFERILVLVLIFIYFYKASDPFLRLVLCICTWLSLDKVWCTWKMARLLAHGKICLDLDWSIAKSANAWGFLGL